MKSIKDRIHHIEETMKKDVEHVTDEVEDTAKNMGSGAKKEFKDLEKLRHYDELIYYKTDALAIVLRKLGGFDEFIKIVDQLTREGYWMMNSEDVKNLLSNFGIALPGVSRGTLYYFQNKKYIN